jgi:hypothetical protein
VTALSLESHSVVEVVSVVVSVVLGVVGVVVVVVVDVVGSLPIPVSMPRGFSISEHPLIHQTVNRK